MPSSTVFGDESFYVYKDGVKFEKGDFAEDTEKMNKFLYYIYDLKLKEDISFANLISKYVFDNTIINGTTHMVLKTKVKNPEIKEWKILKKDQILKLYVYKPYLDLRKMAAPETKVLQEERPEGFHSNVLYMASIGNFTQEKSSNGILLKLSQNSMFSLGYSGLCYPKTKKYSFSSSAYISTLNSTTSNIQDISLGPEIGFNFYTAYPVPQYKFIPPFDVYGGIDFDSFSTFNSSLLYLEDTIKILRTNALYLTVGASKLLNIQKKYNVLAKYSFSYSILSSTDFSSFAIEPESSYSGLKTMVYLYYKFKKKWFAHTMFKYHLMSGPDALSVFRVGVGFGYIIN